MQEWRSRVCTGVVKHRVRGNEAARNNYYKEKQGWDWWKLRQVLAHHGRVDAQMPIKCCTIQNTGVGMDAWVPQLVIDGTNSVVSRVIGGCPNCLDRMRPHWECIELKWIAGMGSGSSGCVTPCNPQWILAIGRLITPGEYRPYLSIADQHTWAPIPIPAFGASNPFLIRCHNPFLKLSLTQPLQTPFGWVYTSDSVRTPLATVIGADSPDWPFGPTRCIHPRPISSELPFQPQAWNGPQDHMGIMWQCQHAYPCRLVADHLAAVWDLRVPTLFLSSISILLHANASIDCSTVILWVPVLIPDWRLIVCPLSCRIPVLPPHVTAAQLQILSFSVPIAYVSLGPCILVS